MQLLYLNIIRVHRFEDALISANAAASCVSIHHSSKLSILIDSRRNQLFKVILNEKYPFFSVAIVELVKWNALKTTRIDRLVRLR